MLVAVGGAAGDEIVYSFVKKGKVRHRKLHPSGNRRNQEHAIAFFERAGFAAEETDVLIVEIDVEELAKLAAVVADVASDGREASREFVQGVGDCAGARVNFLRTVGEATEGSGDFDGDGHLRCSSQFPFVAAAARWVSRRASKASRRGAMASVAGNSAAIASVVLRPLPVMQTTVVSSGKMRPSRMSFSVTPAVTPPAVSVKIPSVSARSLMAATISGSEISSAQPPLSRICLMANGPSAGLPMARERAIVFGFCGSKRARPRLTADEMGEQPVACAPKKRTGFSSTQPSAISSRNALAIFVISEPP